MYCWDCHLQKMLPVILVRNSLFNLLIAMDNCILLHTEILHFTTNSIYGYGFIKLSTRAVLLNELHQRKNVG